MFKQSTGGAVTTLLAAFLAGGLVAWGLSARLLGGHRGAWRGIGAAASGRPGGPGSPEGRRVLARELGLSAAQLTPTQRARFAELTKRFAGRRRGEPTPERR